LPIQSCTLPSCNSRNGIVRRSLGALNLFDAQCLRAAIIATLQAERFRAIAGRRLALPLGAILEDVRQNTARQQCGLNFAG
jgi:hypothetical protein